ncbi:MAG: hypothetical protein OEZ24_02135, partial [Candidatus Bathyarchaeota archaeon]|nr:hypothetical protein [Candidatus Bathyarchaeota archaeon]
ARKLIRVRAELIGTRIVDIVISGDFFMMPEEALKELESILKGATLDREEILARVRGFYRKKEIQSPGITPQDFTEAIMKTKNLAETYGPAVYPYASKKRATQNAKRSEKDQESSHQD